MSDPTEVVGHKTFSDGEGGFRHEPLTRAEADAIWKEYDKSKAKRTADMPTEQDAINVMFEAWQRLKELGWREAMYCPKDCSTFDVIEAGSAGIHKCHYEGKWPDGSWWVHGECGDLWPSAPILYRVKP